MVASYLITPSIGYTIKKIDELFGFYQSLSNMMARDTREERDSRDV
jgi:hypothetical protein